MKRQDKTVKFYGVPKVSRASVKWTPGELDRRCGQHVGLSSFQYHVEQCLKYLIL